MCDCARTDTTSVVNLCSKGTSEPEIGILDFLESKAIAKRSYPGVARAVHFLAAEFDLRRQKDMYYFVIRESVLL